MSRRAHGLRRPAILFMRYGLPAIFIIAGFVILAVAPDASRFEGFSLCIGSGLSILLINLLFRMGATGDDDRRREEEAREYFSRHGHWPDEAPAARRQPSRPERL